MISLLDELSLTFFQVISKEPQRALITWLLLNLYFFYHNNNNNDDDFPFIYKK